MSDTNDTYFDRAEFLKDAADPRYATEARFRTEVEGKLARSLAAGTVTPMGQYVAHGEGKTIHTSKTPIAPEQDAIYGAGVPMPALNPAWTEAAKVRAGVFDGPEAIGRAMTAPHYERDEGYRQAVWDKIQRSISGGHITTDWEPVDPTKRAAQ